MSRGRRAPPHWVRRMTARLIPWFSARRAAGSWHRAHRRADAWRLATDETAGYIIALRDAFVVMKVAVQAGIADHYRAQENDEFALGVCVVPVLEQIAE